MLKSLDHVNLRTEQLTALRDFYCQVLGLSEGPRPNFPFGGAWIYCGQRPVVHLVVAPSGVVPPTPNDSLQHFAFAGEHLGPFLDHLRSHQVPFRIGRVEDVGLCQVNVHDPDGNHVHVDFPLQEADALGLVAG